MSEESRLTSSTSDEDSESSESSRKTSERIFDEIYEKYQKNLPVEYLGVPRLKPIFYEANPEEPPLKWRRIAARGHEHEERKKLIEEGLSKKKADTFAKAASYYPGSMYQALDRTIRYSVTPPRISLSSSDDEASPRFLFKDLPAGMPNACFLSPTCNTSSLGDTITTPQSSLPSHPSVTPERHTDSDELSEVFKTPPRPVVVNYPSPVFDSSKIRRGNRRKNVITIPPKLHESIIDSSNASTNVDDDMDHITIRRRTNIRSPIYVGR